MVFATLKFMENGTLGGRNASPGWTDTLDSTECRKRTTELINRQVLLIDREAAINGHDLMLYPWRPGALSLSRRAIYTNWAVRMAKCQMKDGQKEDNRLFQMKRASYWIFGSPCCPKLNLVAGDRNVLKIPSIPFTIGINRPFAA